MIYIEKTTEPKGLTQWKEQEKEYLEEKYKDVHTKASVIFEHLQNEPKSGVSVTYHKRLLKACLLEEQGYICCYCGGRILNNNNTSIEHLIDKGKNKKLTFDYFNLLASCLGGTKTFYHLLEKGDTLNSIAKEYGVTEESLIMLNVDLINKEELENESAKTLKVGDQLVVIPKAEKGENHCDNRKGSKSILITPLQVDCEAKFYYKLQTGEIKSDDVDAVTTIGVLGLNNNWTLKKRRLNMIDIISRLLQMVYENPAINHEETILGLVDKFKEKNERKYQPYFFVGTKILVGNKK